MGEWESESDLNTYLHSNDFAILKGAITILSVESTDCRALITQVFARHTKAGNSLQRLRNGPR